MAAAQCHQAKLTAQARARAEPQAHLALEAHRRHRESGDLLDAGSHAEAAKRGTQRLEGKTYVVADGDVLNIRFNV